MADLVHFLHTGQADRPHSARIVQPPEGMTVSACTVCEAWVCVTGWGDYACVPLQPPVGMHGSAGTDQSSFMMY